MAIAKCRVPTTRPRTRTPKTQDPPKTQQMVLESYFINILETTNGFIYLRGDQLQALHTLVGSYLSSLSIPVRSEEKNCSNMFGSRYLYLDLLPPFKTKSNIKEVLLDAESPECAKTVCSSCNPYFPVAYA